MTENRNDEEALKKEIAEKRRRRVRALILGSLATGGVFQLNSWQAQAHGNRSTKAEVGEFQDLALSQPPQVIVTEDSANTVATQTGDSVNDVAKKSE